MIEYLDFGAIEPFTIRLLRGDENDWGDRFQTVAVENKKRVIGRWLFSVQSKRGCSWINSGHTRVMRKHQHQGVAWRLWQCGIERWHPSWIEASIGTYAGCSFLASVAVRLAVQYPSIELLVGYDEWRPTFERLASQKALAELRSNAHSTATKRRLELVP